MCYFWLFCCFLHIDFLDVCCAFAFSATHLIYLIISFLAGAVPAPAAKPFRSALPAASPAAARFLPELDAATAASGSCFFVGGRRFACGFSCGDGPCPNKGAGGGGLCRAVSACVFYARCRFSLSRSTLLMSFALSASPSGDGATSVAPLVLSSLLVLRVLL